MKNKRRWTDSDKHFGPFTYGLGRAYKAYGLLIDSGDGDESPGCCLRIHFGPHTVIVELPQIIKTWRNWVDTSGYSWSTGGGGYWEEHNRKYGFTVSDGFLQVFHGPQTHDSSTTKNWSKFLPWTQWRSHRFSLYGIDGEHNWTQLDSDKPGSYPRYEAQRKAEESCPSVSFEFEDYDGERIAARTHIEEREWLFGEGWFKWLSWFRKPLVKRSLDIEFSKEVGSRKGSWKGGTLGHSIEMLPGELHEGAFRRYCAANNLTFAVKA